MKDFGAEDYINYRINRSWATMREVEVHLENEFWNTAINRMYYACFYAVGALLIKHGVEASTHAGVRQQFGQHFVKTGKIDRELSRHFSEISEKRNRGDYDDFVVFDEETAKVLYPKSVALIEAIEKLLQ